MKYDILAVEWRSGQNTVGFVAYKTHGDTWCATVGTVGDLSTSEENDAQLIAAWGAKLTWKEAQAFFPQLDITKYKYYENVDGPKQNDQRKTISSKATG